MTKLTKLINSPEKFISDAIKKKFILFEYKVRLLNGFYKAISSEREVCVNSEVVKTFHLAMRCYENYRVRHHLISWMYFRQSLNTRDPLIIVACTFARLNSN